MAADKVSLDAYVAGNKFGLGLRPGELAHIQGDPRGWLQQQLTQITQLPSAYQTLSPSPVLLQRSYADMEDARSAVKAANQAADDEAHQNGTTVEPEAFKAARQPLNENNRASRLEFSRQLGMRMQLAVTTPLPFAERLLRFWSNHFTIAPGGGLKKNLQQIAVAYENEAIRSRLGGSFADLLLAVEQHPAMLIYLDNAASIGPQSMFGLRSKRGLNENLAREILELHSLGVNGGYTQQDVTTLAKIITGWTVGGLGKQAALQQNPGAFLFVLRMHEPGAQLLLGQRYPDNGLLQGEHALRAVATHPATARHVAFKLARHFVSDQPPPAAVDELTRVFIKTEGDLPSLHTALIRLDAGWQPEQRKFKTPEELVISLGRAMDTEALTTSDERRFPGKNRNFLLEALSTLGQVPFNASSPAGWPDVADYWGGADALMKRIEWSTAVAQRLGNQRDARALYAQLMPEQALLKQELARAESPTQALALLVGSPQFQWR